METLMQDILCTLAFAVGFALVGSGLYLFKTYLLPWIQTRIGTGNFNTMLSFVRNYMASAEVKFPKTKTGKDKAAWVIEQVTAQLKKLGIYIEEEVIQAAIDGSMAALENANIVNRK